MKKTFLNLRKMGFVLVAATSMVAFSCGGGTDEEQLEEDLTNALEEALEEVEADMEEATEDTCDGGEAMEADSTAEGSCEEGACEEGACEEGQCEGAEHSCEHGE